MFYANQSQTLILITWPNMSALAQKMGNPSPNQGIPYTITPSISIFVYKNSLRKLWNYEKSTLPRDHEGYNIHYLPDYLHPWKEL